jgi:hypothetical protein
MKANKSAPQEPCKVMCATCPFRNGSPYAHLAAHLTERSLVEGRICHNTGRNPAIKYVNTPARICRGSRDIQLKMFHATGFLDAPTDEAWTAKQIELGIISPPTKPKSKP